MVLQGAVASAVNRLNPTDVYWKIFEICFSRTRLAQGQPVSQAAADSSQRRQLQLLNEGIGTQQKCSSNEIYGPTM